MKKKITYRISFLLLVTSGALFGFACGPHSKIKYTDPSNPDASANKTRFNLQALSIPSDRLNSLSDCTSDKQCHADEVCANLDLTGGHKQKCMSNNDICAGMSCSQGNCSSVAITSNEQSLSAPSVFVTCFKNDPGSVAGNPGAGSSNPGSPGSGDAGATIYSIEVTSVSNVVGNAQSFSLTGRTSTGESVQMSFNQAIDPTCYSDALRASSAKISFTVMGVWTVVSQPNSTVKLLKFSEADMCYSGTPIGL